MKKFGGVDGTVHKPGFWERAGRNPEIISKAGRPLTPERSQLLTLSGCPEKKA